MNLTDILLFGKVINGGDGGGGGGETAVKVMVAERMDDVDCVIPAGYVSEAPLYKIGDYAPTVEEMRSAIFTINSKDGAGAAIRMRALLTGTYVIEDLTADVGFPFYIVLEALTEQAVIFVCGEDSEEEEEGSFIKAGTYFTSEYIAFPRVSMLIIGA